MRDRNVFGIKKVLPRMSWSPRNLYNLYRRSLTDLKDQTVFTQSGLTLFQQRWKAKQLTRAYHGDFINEKIFKRWYLPSTLPDVRPRTRLPSSANGGNGNGNVLDDMEPLMKWVMKDKEAERVRKKREDDKELLAQAPVASLMFEEVERRIDVFIFRCCFTHSVYEARRLVIHGDVLLNGKKHTNANTRIAPGDMVSVNPAAIRFLRDPPPPKPEPKPESESSTDSESKPDSEESKDASDEVPDAPLDGSHIHKYSFANPIWTSPPSTSTSTTSTSTPDLTPFHLPPYAAPSIFIPAYIEVNFLTCSAIFVRRPTARYNYSEIPSPYEADGELMRLTWEWYNKVRPRMRSRRQLARMPENRRETRRIGGGVGLGLGLGVALPEGTSLKAQIARNSVY